MSIERMWRHVCTGCEFPTCGEIRYEFRDALEDEKRHRDVWHGTRPRTIEGRPEA